MRIGEQRTVTPSESHRKPPSQIPHILKKMLKLHRIACQGFERPLWSQVIGPHGEPLATSFLPCISMRQSIKVDKERKGKLEREGSGVGFERCIKKFLLMSSFALKPLQLLKGTQALVT
jgi:hypothetical protein